MTIDEDSTATEFASQITLRNDELRDRWADRMRDDPVAPGEQVAARVFAEHADALLAAVAAALRGEDDWQDSKSDAMAAARQIGTTLSSALTGRVLSGYRDLMETIDALALQGDGDLAAAEAARALAPVRHAVWLFAATSVDAMLEAADAEDGAAGGPAARQRAEADYLRAARHELRNCLNNMALTIALLDRGGAGGADPDAVGGIKEEIGAMSQIIAALHLPGRGDS